MRRHALIVLLAFVGFAAFAFLSGWVLSAMAAAGRGLVGPYLLAGAVTVFSLVALAVWALRYADHDDRIGRD